MFAGNGFIAKKIAMPLLLLLPLGAMLAAAMAQDEPKPPSRATFMRTKLMHAQKVLEGIAKEDYTEVAKSSQAISLLTLEEQWNVLTTEQYVRQSRAFREAADSLTDAAKAKNLDAASLAYVEMTLSCVKCHKLLRAKAPGSAK
jgi:cytochrome c556